MEHRINMSVNGSVVASLSYYSRTSDGKLPFSRFGGKPGDKSPMSNVVSELKETTINDIRGKENIFDLDVHGFQPILNAPTIINELIDSNGNIDTVDKEEWFKHHMKCLVEEHWYSSIAYCDVFMINFRSSKPEDKRRKPSPLIHVDQTPATGVNYTEGLPQEVQEKVKNGTWRLRILSVWQPLVQVVLDWPLAMAESESCPESLLISCETRFPSTPSGEMALVHTPPGNIGLKWWYWSSMAPHEVLMIKNYDSFGLSRCPHTSFRDPRVPSTSTQYRKSAEARVIVVTST
ncbi:hypothetical protein THRCLA_21355 [Thraustotheca clavata]|uniref:Uncharacterized protein n=1 Tax=Thraustotheca clavata TaxID=74557 RepID=A0A1V9ZY41_9STRA|nr:hypothetical protein THRCLA_21355 [Thraustotheca clavata]